MSAKVGIILEHTKLFPHFNTFLTHWIFIEPKKNEDPTKAKNLMELAMVGMKQ